MSTPDVILLASSWVFNLIQMGVMLELAWRHHPWKDKWRRGRDTTAH